MREILAGLSVIALMLLIIFAINSIDLVNYKFFAPKYESARREVFENTKSYRDGLRRDFDNLYVAYTSAKTDDEKIAIMGVIKSRAIDLPDDMIPAKINKLLDKGN